MNERKINLEEILNDCVYINDEIKPMVKNAMREACRQILELAAENAKINWVENNVEMESDTDFSFRDNDGNWCKIKFHNF